jgi:hypothetical protein
MYNKSEIMKNAWELYRVRKEIKLRMYETATTFADALKETWATAKVKAQKAAQGCINITELNIGDEISIEYGDYNNFVICTVTSVTDRGDKFNCGINFFDVTATSKNGLKINFCEKAGDMIIVSKRAAEIREVA